MKSQNFSNQWNSISSIEKEIITCNFMNKFNMEDVKIFRKMLKGEFPMDEQQEQFLDSEIENAINNELNQWEQ